MRVRVVLFARPRELVGQPTVELTVPAGARAEDAWNALAQRHPQLGSLPKSYRCAVNSEYAGWDVTLKEGDELAVIPPVSGGLQCLREHSELQTSAPRRLQRGRRAADGASPGAAGVACARRAINARRRAPSRWKAQRTLHGARVREGGEAPLLWLS